MAQVHVGRTPSALRGRVTPQERRRHLLSVATKLIQDRGFDAVSVNELAEHAGMSVGGLYRYITTKSDVLVMVCEGIYGSTLASMAESDDLSAGSQERLRLNVRRYFEECLLMSEDIRLMYREYRNLPLEAQSKYKTHERAIGEVFAHIIREGVEAAVFRAVDPGLVAQNIVFLGHLPALKNWSFAAETNWDAYLDDQVDLVLAGL